MMDLERSETWSDFKLIGPNHNFTPHAAPAPSSERTSSLFSTTSASSNGIGLMTTHNLENDAYRAMNDDGSVLDEETINWPVLLTRVFAFFLLFLVILFCSLEQVSRKFLWLGAIVCVILFFVLVSTFVDLRPYICCCCPSSIYNSNYFVTRRSIIITKSSKVKIVTSPIVTSSSSINNNFIEDSVVMQYAGAITQNPMQLPQATALPSTKSTDSLR